MAIFWKKERGKEFKRGSHLAYGAPEEVGKAPLEKWGRKENSGVPEEEKTISFS